MSLRSVATKACFNRNGKQAINDTKCRKAKNELGNLAKNFPFTYYLPNVCVFKVVCTL